MIEKVNIILPLPQFSNTSHRKDVTDFAHSMGRPTRLCRPIQQGRRGRGHGVIVAVGGAVERLRRAGEGPRNHTAHVHRVQMRGKRGTKRKQTVKAKTFLVRGNLEHAIGRGVADRPTSFQMRFNMLGDDGHARRMAVAQDTVRSRQLAHQRHQIGRKGGDGVRKIGPLPRHGHPCQFPMSRGRVFATADLGCRPPQALRHKRQARRFSARGKAYGSAQTQPIQMRQMQRACTPDIGLPCGAGLGDMGQGVGPRIAEISSIGRATAADGIHDDDKGAVGGSAHQVIRFKISAGSAGATSPIT